MYGVSFVILRVGMCVFVSYLVVSDIGGSHTQS